MKSLVHVMGVFCSRGRGRGNVQNCIRVFLTLGFSVAGSSWNGDVVLLRTESRRIPPTSAPRTALENILKPDVPFTKVQEPNLKN